MKKWWLVFLSFTVLACTQEPTPQMVLFSEQEEGVDPYQTRIIVTPKYLRFDEGENSDTYLLYDRTNKVAYSVNHNTNTTMLLHYKTETVESPMELKYTSEIIDDVKDAPEINKVKPVHRQLKTNDVICLDIVSVDGLLPETVQALREFQMLLSSDSAVTFNTIPADMHEPCTLAMNTFAPTRHLEFGFPVQSWKEGYSRSLIDYNEDFKTKPEYFSLPTNYFTYSVQEFREGRVDLENEKVIRDEPSDAAREKSSGKTTGEKANEANAEKAGPASSSETN